MDKKTGALLDMPVTFHSQIRSSGYGGGGSVKKKPQQATAAPAAGAGKVSRSSSASRTAGRRTQTQQGAQGVRTQGGSQLVSYPSDCRLITALDAPSGYPAQASGAGRPAAVCPLLGVRYSSDGRYLGLVSQEGAVQTIRVPVSKHKGIGSVYIYICILCWINIYIYVCMISIPIYLFVYLCAYIYAAT